MQKAKLNPTSYKIQYEKRKAPVLPRFDVKAASLLSSRFYSRWRCSSVGTAMSIIRTLPRVKDVQAKSLAEKLEKKLSKRKPDGFPQLSTCIRRPVYYVVLRAKEIVECFLWRLSRYESESYATDQTRACIS